ncbi:MAG: AMP-binding protein [Ruminococcus sp.]|uniref:AMP-binding protein n=1 Tax=Ruminococcus sp. TaxID=41978 RepID=UPI002873C5CE|nr:AMP-binding protein [Ruminococcus sp.]MBQ3285448.1 AMP-binding protein [Ruminococcus sp.]MBQ3286269.1 AMP-binding protein [Ruminococcus sp.]
MNILETLSRYTEARPNAPILFDEAHSKGITYAQLDDMSGRVYAYLSGKGIGKEDFVLINLPRGILPIIAMVGVWKAGAAWALVEDTYAPERIDFIRKDCGCKTELSAENWEDVMATEPKSGFTPSDDHDAAYAIYTSGTTGNPKGVLHEYGNLSRAIESVRINGENPFNDKDRLALLAPLNFVASVIVILEALSICGGKIFVVGYATIKNPLALKRFFLEKRVTITFLTPSYVRMLGNQTGPFLRMLFVGSEPANNIYNKNLELINIYAASESGFAVGVFKIDRAYETCPIGKPEIDTKIVLINEDGEEVEDGEIGELCLENPFVRGYINLPEETEKAFKDGIYHTGDLARKDENGNYVLLGRSGDMIKINGNRIEPAEIEASVKQALGVDWVAARGFEESGKSYLCAYYTADIQFDPDELREKLAKRLPYYMIPAYYIKIDKVPLKANGKMDRKALPQPDASDFKTDYAPPENEIQQKLCDAMAVVLKLDQVGINDDFYELGGDSLGSIRVITESGLPGLNAGEIFRGRTPKKIAALYEESCLNDDGEAPEIKNARAMKSEHPLTVEQLYMVDYQLYTPKSTMYNLFSMMKMDKELVDMQRIAEALQTAIRNHSALLTTFRFNEDGDIVQRYTPEVMQDIRVEKLTEFEFDSLKDTLVQPFKIIGGCLHRCRVFETEKNGYIFFDVHHTLFDGTSLKVFMGNVGKAYMGMQPDPDLYYLILQNREDEKQTEFYQESKRYFEDRYEGVDWSSYPDVDYESRENEMGEIFAPIGIEQPQMKAMERRYRISRNEFFISVAALAISIYNRKDDIMLSWVYNGREDMIAMNSVGLLFRELPVGLRMKDDMTIRDLFADVQDQVQKGIEHCCYPYVDTHNQAGSSESAYLLYQRDIRDMGGLEELSVEAIDIRQNQAASQTILDMEILDGADGLELMIDYTASLYEDESMEEFKNTFVKVAQALVTHFQDDLTVGEIRKKCKNKFNFFATFRGAFKRKK